MTEIEVLKQEVREVLERNILPFWIDRMQDNEHGGFYGRIDGNNVLHADADKGAILNARILWAFSAAWRVLQKAEYLEMAHRAKRFFIDHFIDREYGGVYWSLDYKGQPKDTKKQFYAIGFAIYGLSEYARATSDREALEQAIALYHCIEEHALDHVYNGYIEATTRNWQPIEDMRLSEIDANYPKSQNTHLHILEPYTNLYRVWPSKELEQSLRNIITVFTNNILNPETYHLDLFFNMDWTRCPGQMESYGHDIECSWLLHEAAQVLGDRELLGKVEPIVKKVARSLTPSPSPRGKGSLYLSENGFCFEQPEVTTPLSTRRGAGGEAIWWVQAEAVVGFINIYQHFHDESALEKALRCWQYIKDNLIDRENGEWYWSRHPDGSLNTIDDKAGFWKCPYHNSRMCIEIMEREIP